MATEVLTTETIFKLIGLAQPAITSKMSAAQHDSYSNDIVISASTETIESILDKEMAAFRKEMSDKEYDIDLQVLTEWNAQQTEDARYNFLRARYYYLNQINKGFAAKKIVEHQCELPPTVDAGKKMIDALDDIWSTVKGGLVPEKIGNIIGPLIVGATGGIIHLFEGYEATKMAYFAFKDEKTLARKAKIAAGVGIFAFAGVGTGLSASYLAAAAGATVSGVALMPFLIPAFLTGIYFISQWRRIEIHKAAQEVVIKTEKNCNELATNNDYLAAVNNIQNNRPLSQPQVDKLAEYQVAKKLHEEAQAKCHEAKRAARFGYVEVAAATVVMIGTVLSMAAIVGAAAVASCGILPTVLLAMGVATAFLSKIIEKNNYEVPIARAFAKAGKWISEKIFGNSPVTTPTINVNPQPTPTPRSVVATPAQPIAIPQSKSIPLRMFSTPQTHRCPEIEKERRALGFSAGYVR